MSGEWCVGMFPLMLTALNRDYSTSPPILISFKDCWYKGDQYVAGTFMYDMTF